MKNSVTIVLLLIAFFSTGQVINRTVELKYELVDKLEAIHTWKIERTYDSSGNLLVDRHSRCIDPQDLKYNLVATQIFEYNNGRLRRFERYDEYDSLIYYETYTEGDSIEHSIPYLDPIVEVATLVYNDSNQLIQRKTKSSDLFITYNEYGLIAVESHRSINSKYNVEYHYDKNSDLVSIVTPMGTTDIKYFKFNKNGDWIERKETHNYINTKIELIKRSIVYY